MKWYISDDYILNKKEDYNDNMIEPLNLTEFPILSAELFKAINEESLMVINTPRIDWR
jgi:hypothetical protein